MNLKLVEFGLPTARLHVYKRCQMYAYMYVNADKRPRWECRETYSK